MRSRKVLRILLAAVILLGLLPAAGQPAHAGHKKDTDIAWPVTNGNIYFDKDTGTVTDCDRSVTAAAIPDSIGGVAVRCIGYEAFEECPKLESVTIPDSVTEIQLDAFSRCTGLTSLTMGNGVKLIGRLAFYGCRGLKSLTLPTA